MLAHALRARMVAELAGVLLAAAGICAVTVIPARADAVRDQEMWVLDMVGAPSAWPVTQGQNVMVAVIDSGVSPVSDLAGSVIKGPDLSGVRTPPSSASWGVHGTWMASLIAGHGHGDGSSGIEGVAPASRVLSIRVVTDRGDPNFGQYQRESNTQVQRALAKAIMVATRRGTRVISMSLGYGAPSRPVRAALQNALDHGVVVVASTGNSGAAARARSSGQAPYSFPADYPGVLGVGAVTQTGSAAGFSSDNLSVEVAAPGVKVPAQGRDGQYWLVSGTSPACALTAGVAALIKSRYPHLSPALVDQAITSSAQNPPPQGYDDRVGFGTVDAAAALTAAARLTRNVDTGRGVRVATHFGGGPGAAPPVPVAPRGQGRLVLYALLVLACLAVAGAAAARLTRRQPAAVPGGGSWPDDGTRPDDGRRPAARQVQPVGRWPDDRRWPDDPRWPDDRRWPDNVQRPDEGQRPNEGPWPDNGRWPDEGGWPGDGRWPDNEPWPHHEPWRERQGRWHAPSGHGPASPGAHPAPAYWPPPDRLDLPPDARPPDARPPDGRPPEPPPPDEPGSSGLPWLSPGS